MGSLIVELLARAFGVFSFVVAYLTIGQLAFPTNWVALGAVFLVAIPLALLYGWLSGDYRRQGDARRWHVPRLLLIAVGVAVVSVGNLMHKVEVDRFFFPQ